MKNWLATVQYISWMQNRPGTWGKNKKPGKLYRLLQAFISLVILIPVMAFTRRQEKMGQDNKPFIYLIYSCSDRHHSYCFLSAILSRSHYKADSASVLEAFHQGINDLLDDSLKIQDLTGMKFSDAYPDMDSARTAWIQRASLFESERDPYGKVKKVFLVPVHTPGAKDLSIHQASFGL